EGNRGKLSRVAQAPGVEANRTRRPLQGSASASYCKFQSASGFGAGRFNDFLPLLLLAGHQLAHFLNRISLWQEARLLHALLQLRVSQHLVQRGIELLKYGARGATRSAQIVDR